MPSYQNPCTPDTAKKSNTSRSAGRLSRPASSEFSLGAVHATRVRDAVVRAAPDGGVHDAFYEGGLRFIRLLREEAPDFTLQSRRGPRARSRNRAGLPKIRSATFGGRVTRTVRPLLVVPGLFSTEIVDEEQGHVWGRLRNLYGGPPIATLAGLRGKPGAIVRVIPIIPRIYDYDLMRSLERALVGAGYRLDETLHYFAYDWRLRIIDLGVALAAEVRRIAAKTGGEIDMLGLSNGGPMIRAAFAADRTLPVERVVTSGGPHGGTVETIACLDRGFQFAPLGRTVRPAEFMACPGALQAIPSPALAKFVGEDEGGADLYDVGTWRRLRLSVFRRDPDDPVWIDVVGKRLADMRETWRLLDAAGAPRRLVCICGTGIPTQVGIVVRKGRAYLPGEGRLAGIPPAAITDGDGALTVKQASAWTGADVEVLPIAVTRHRDTVRTPVAFAAILKALAA
jgi:hypothetical protein